MTIYVLFKIWRADRFGGLSKISRHLWAWKAGTGDLAACPPRWSGATLADRIFFFSKECFLNPKFYQNSVSYCKLYRNYYKFINLKLWFKAGYRSGRVNQNRETLACNIILFCLSNLALIAEVNIGVCVCLLYLSWNLLRGFFTDRTGIWLLFYVYSNMTFRSISLNKLLGASVNLVSMCLKKCLKKYLCQSNKCNEIIVISVAEVFPCVSVWLLYVSQSLFWLQIYFDIRTILMCLFRTPDL